MNDPLPSELRFLNKFGKLILLWDKWPWIANAIATIAALLVGAATAIDSIPSRNVTTAVWLAGILATALIMLIANRGASKRATRTLDFESRIRQLENEGQAARDAESGRKEKQIADLQSAARALLQESGLDEDDTRISVYQRIEERQEFSLLVRVSQNPKLELLGRPTYPDSYGLISKAWEHIRTHHAEWRVEPNEWVDKQVQKFDIPKEIAESIKMQSRSMLGVRIDYDHERVGIAIIESLERSRVTPAHQDSIPSLAAFGQIQMALRALS